MVDGTAFDDDDVELPDLTKLPMSIGALRAIEEVVDMLAMDLSRFAPSLGKADFVAVLERLLLVERQ